MLSTQHTGYESGVASAPQARKQPKKRQANPINNWKYSQFLHFFFSNSEHFSNICKKLLSYTLICKCILIIRKGDIDIFYGDHWMTMNTLRSVETHSHVSARKQHFLHCPFLQQQKTLELVVLYFATG